MEVSPQWVEQARGFVESSMGWEEEDYVPLYIFI